jgi:acyl transferase domain-containing protein
MVEVGELYQSLIAKYVSPKTPIIPFYSSVTCKVITQAEELGPSYWRQNLESPVLFYAAVTQLLQGPLHSNLHLEVGPHGALAGPLRQIYKERGSTIQYVSTLTRQTNPTTSLLSAMGQLYCLGVPLDFANIQLGITLGDVPKYPWLRDTRYWNESRAMRAWRLREFPHHDVLGSRVVEASDLEPTWRNILRVEEVSWIADHLVHTDIVYPAAGYIAIAGEAVRQLSGSSDYTLKDVTISKALVLRPAKPTEIITTLRSAMLTDTLDSGWYDFSIVSYGSGGWIKNCSGQVRGGAASRYPVRDVSILPRHVASRRWYAAMKRVGLEYGPAFIGLSDITAGVVKKSASATVVDRQQEQESPYQLHPTTIDLIFQALSVAVFNGQPRDFDILNLPTSIKELYIGAGTYEELRIHINTSVTPSRVVTGDGYGMAGERLAFFLDGLKLSPLEDEDPEHDADPHAAVQLEWKPDIDLFDAGMLMRPARDVRSAHVLVERLSLACTIESSLQLKATDSTLPHLKKYHTWLRSQVERIREGDCAVVQDVADLLSLSSRKRCALIESLAAAAQHTAGAAVGTAIHRIFKSSQDIFMGRVVPLEILLQDNILTDFYNFADLWDCTDLMHLLSHSKPTLRILEIGAGTGSITATILQDLTSSYGERMYSTYTYTDISAGFFVAAKERFKAYAGVEYATLDISKDPIEQGFEAQSFDLIVAANVRRPSLFLCALLSLSLTMWFSLGSPCNAEASRDSPQCASAAPSSRSTFSSRALSQYVSILVSRISILIMPSFKIHKLRDGR